MKTNIRKPADAEVHAGLAGRPFEKCTECGTFVGPSSKMCPGCERLKSLGMTTDKSKVADVSEVQSNPASDHSGFSTTAGGKK